MFALMMITLYACDEKDYSEDYDVDWPIPAISSVSPEQAPIESEITITGVNLDKTNRVTIGTVAAEIISKSETQVVVKVPRLASNDKIKLTTLYKREAISDIKFLPEFPETAVSTWPSIIYRGQTFKISGENVDLITSVIIGSTEVVVDGSKGTADEVTISTANVNLAGVDNVVIKIKSSKGGVDGVSVSPEIPVEDPTDIFEPVEPVVLFDFENNVNPFVMQSAFSVTSTLNGNSLPKARGQHYLTVKATGVTTWQDIGYIEIAEAVDLTEFHAPHISFLINTNGNAGYFQLEDGQGNWYHFLKSPDSYMFSTTGWEWRSYDLGQVDDGKPFDLANVKAKLMFKTGNVAGNFDLSIDQIMITDGPVAIKKVVFDFEAGGSPYAGTATSSINSGAGAVPTIMGNKFLTVTKSGAATWDWTGDMSMNESVDLSEMVDPHLSFWVNTGSNYGNFQVEITQAGTKWGSDPFSKEQNDLGGYAVKTDGAWKLYSFRMRELMVSKWGGDGAAFDPMGVLDYVKIGLSTGNAAGNYEVNIDHVVVSDGPVF
jgi:hypothetical protein